MTLTRGFLHPSTRPYEVGQYVFQGHGRHTVPSTVACPYCRQVMVHIAVGGRVAIVRMPPTGREAVLTPIPQEMTVLFCRPCDQVFCGEAPQA